MTAREDIAAKWLGMPIGAPNSVAREAQEDIEALIASEREARGCVWSIIGAMEVAFGVRFGGGSMDEARRFALGQIAQMSPLKAPAKENPDADE
jgi:hypothetical protein